MHKGYFFDLLKVQKGRVITLFRIFKIATKYGDEGLGKFVLIQFGILKLELTLSFTWRNEKTYEENVQAKA